MQQSDRLSTVDRSVSRDYYQAVIGRQLIFTGGVGARAQIAKLVAARKIALASGIPIESFSHTTLNPNP